MLNIRHVNKSFAQHGQVNQVLSDLSLDVAPREIFTLLGASGCGKTTLLRMVAGLETPDAGQIIFNGQVWADPAAGVLVPPQKRRIGLVFQSYALWPHLTVAGNVAYPLTPQKLGRAAVAEQVGRTLASVGLEGFETRFPHQLSGGQQQRVAMARALVGQPQLLLLDEPFSNLDVGLRQKLRLELRDLQKRLGLAVILVTHDQDDAFALSDRIAVMKAGRVEQIGTAEQLHDDPASGFVNGFVGKSSPLRAVATRGQAGSFEVHIQGVAVPVKTTATPPPSGADVLVHVRPDAIRLAALPANTVLAGAGLMGDVSHTIFSGDRYETWLRLGDGQTLMTYQSREGALAAGQRVRVDFIAPLNISAGPARTSREA